MLTTITAHLLHHFISLSLENIHVYINWPNHMLGDKLNKIDSLWIICYHIFNYCLNFNSTHFCNKLETCICLLST